MFIYIPGMPIAMFIAMPALAWAIPIAALAFAIAAFICMFC